MQTAVSTTVQNLVDALINRGTITEPGETAHLALLDALSDIEANNVISLDKNGYHGPSSPITLSAEEVEILLEHLGDSSPEIPITLDVTAEPAPNQPRTIGGSAEPQDAIAPLVVDASILPAEMVTEIDQQVNAYKAAAVELTRQKLGGVTAQSVFLEALTLSGNAQRGAA